MVETHLSVQKDQAVVRQLQSKGYKAWLSVPLAPVAEAAPLRGGVLIMARACLQVRAVPLAAGLGQGVGAETRQHAVAALVKGVGVEYILVACTFGRPWESRAAPFSARVERGSR